MPASLMAGCCACGADVVVGYLWSQPAAGELVIPLQTKHGLCWLDTGDIACMDSNGFINLIGRAKRFAKIGG